MYLESHHQPIVYAHLKMCPHDSEHIVMHDAFASIACETNFHMMQKVITFVPSTTLQSSCISNLTSCF
jgi:hypothetical protein